MSNPNKALGEWILRKVLNKKPWEIVTMKDLDRLGFNSVCIENLHTKDEKKNSVYRISLADKGEDYQSFASIL